MGQSRKLSQRRDVRSNTVMLALALGSTRCNALHASLAIRGARHARRGRRRAGHSKFAAEFVRVFQFQARAVPQTEQGGEALAHTRFVVPRVEDRRPGSRRVYLAARRTPIRGRASPRRCFNIARRSDPCHETMPVDQWKTVARRLVPRHPLGTIPGVGKDLALAREDEGPRAGPIRNAHARSCEPSFYRVDSVPHRASMRRLPARHRSSMGTAAGIP